MDWFCSKSRIIILPYLHDTSHMKASALNAKAVLLLSRNLHVGLFKIITFWLKSTLDMSFITFNAN